MNRQDEGRELWAAVRWLQNRIDEQTARIDAGELRDLTPDVERMVERRWP